MRKQALWSPGASNLFSCSPVDLKTCRATIVVIFLLIANTLISMQFLSHIVLT